MKFDERLFHGGDCISMQPLPSLVHLLTLASCNSTYLAVLGTVQITMCYYCYSHCCLVKLTGSFSGPGEHITCKSVVITTGTFLKGIIHVGSKTKAAGRMPS